MKYILTLLFLTGCLSEARAPRSEYWFDGCVKVYPNMYRCENKEVVCYKNSSVGSISCFPKN